MKPFVSVIKNSYLWLLVGAFILGISRVLFFFNMNLSEEFTGGISMSFQTTSSQDQISNSLSEYLHTNGYGDSNIHVEKNKNETKLKINTRLNNDLLVKELSEDVQSFLVTENIIADVDMIHDWVVVGPSIGSYMQNTAFKALIFGIIAMSIYMIFSFGTVRKFIPPTILVAVVVATSVLNISVPLGAYGLWMSINPTVQIDSVFVIAILTIIGYGINDVIVIFDRIRENLTKNSGQKKIDYLKVFEDSIWQSMLRSIGTSLSTILVLVAMMIFGTGIIQKFAFTVGIGVMTAFLSSIFIGAPMAYLMLGKKLKK